MTREKKKEQRRCAILTAAATEFKGRRFDEVTLEEVAERAGVGKGTLYLYFKNKEDLFVQLAIEGVDEMVERIGAILAMPASYQQRFFLFASELGEFFYRRHGLMRMMQQSMTGAMEAKFDLHRRMMINAVYGFLQHGVSEGVFRGDVGTDALQCVLVGPMFLRARMEDKAGKKVEMNSLIQLFWDAATTKEQG